MARSIRSLRSYAPARALSALMRSAFDVFSLSTRAPQMAMILSASLDAAAATQGAGSICGSVTGSVPVARAAGGSAAHKRDLTAALWTKDAKQRCIELFIPRRL